MEAELFNCPVCYESFDLSEHLPRNLSVCGHLICSCCLNQILIKDRQPKCPLDKLLLPQQRDVNSFPVNIVVRQLLETRLDSGFCNDHQLENRFICFHEKKIICERCSDIHQEQGHQVRSLKPIQERANYNKKEIKDFLDVIQVWHKTILNQIKDNQETYTKAIKQKFDQLRDMIYEKENEILFELNFYYDIQKHRLGNLLGNNSQLYKSFSDKYAKLQNMKDPVEFLAVLDEVNQIKENILRWRGKVDINLIQQNIQKELDLMIKPFGENFQHSEKDIANTKIILSDPFVALVNCFSEEPIDKIISSYKSNSELSQLVTHTQLKVEFIDDNLNIKSIENPQEILLDFTKLREAKKVILTLTHEISKEDKNLLSHIWRSLADPSTLELKLASKTVSDELCRALSGGPQTFSSILVDLEEHDLDANPEVLALIRQTLKKIKSIKSLTLKAKKVKFPTEGMSKLFELANFNVSELTDFNLNLAEANLKEEALEIFLIPMPNLCSLVLNLDSIGITDKTLKTLAEQVFSQNTCLENIELNFNFNRISDNGIVNLLKKFTKPKQLRLSIIDCEITDRTPRFISELLSNQFANLVTLQLGFFGLKLSDEGLKGIFRPMPKLTNFAFAVSGTGITDKTIESFVENILVHQNFLEHLGIGLLNTKVIDQSIIKLSENISNLKRLKFYLHSAGITEKSVKALLNKLSMMENLVDLILDVDKTGVSEEVQREISNLLQKANKNM